MRWDFGRSAILGCLALTALMGSAQAVSARSPAVRNLRSALLKPSEIPAGFSHPHVVVYHHFATAMQVTSSVASSPAASSCSLPAEIENYGWQQGLIEAYDRSSPILALQLCASLYRSAKLAHAAYLKTISTNIRPLIAMHIVTPLPGRVGDESLGTMRSDKKCVCDKTPSLRTYEVVFRHSNAVIDLTYAGPRTFTPADFFRLGGHTNAQLR